MADILANNRFDLTFLYETCCILIQFKPKFVPKGQINNIQTLVQKVAYLQLGGKPFHGLMEI